MSKQANPTLIGAFVLGAIALFVAALLLFGGGDFFAEKRRYVMFFEGTVTGLDVGAPVKLRGVPVGKVVDIKAVFSRKQAELWIPVIFEFDERRVNELEDGETLTEEERAQQINKLIERGLRGQLTLESFITGRLFIQVNFFPDTKPQYVGVDMGYPELPTVPSATEEMQGNLKTFVDKVNELPLQDLLINAVATLRGLEGLVNDPALKELVGNANKTVLNLNGVLSNLDNRIGEVTAELDQTLQDTRKLVNHVDRQVDPLATGGVQTLTAAREVLDEAYAVLANIDELSAQDSALNRDLSDALRQISAAARSIRNMADYIERNPNAIITGKGATRGR